MSQYLKWFNNMRSEEELCPTNVRFPPNNSNERIDPDETQDEPFFEISLEILKNNTIYNALTLITKVHEDLRFQINKHKNLEAKHETIPYLTFTKLIIRHLLSQNLNLNKRLDSPPHLIADDARLEKLKYVAKGERKLTFGMPIPVAMMSSEIKESKAYMNYVTKYTQAQTTPKHGMGKGLMRKGDVPTSKKKKDAIPRHKRLITVDDNVLSDPEDALEYAKKVRKESKKQAILEEIKRKDTGEGLGASLKYPDHSSSSDDSSESASGDKTESERDSNHDKSHNDYEIGDESDKFTYDEEHIESDESDKDSDIVDDQTKDFVIKLHDKEPKQPPNALPTPSPSVTTTSAKDYTTYLNDPRDDKEQEHEVQNDEGRGKDNPEWFQKVAELFINPEGDRFHHGLSKPLPLIGPPDRKRIPVSYFFNHDLEYLKYGTKENTIQKYNKDAELGINHLDEHRQWFYKGNIVLKSRYEVYSKLNIKSVQSIKVNKNYRYTHLEEIVVTRIDEKEYKFAEADCNQEKSKDVQMGVEGYQTKLNLTNPQLKEGCLHQKMLYTILSHPRDVVYEGNDYRKRLIRVDKLNKFYDGTLNKVLNKL
ncbi:hypothetical protein Tco_0370667 [Tanacetum coccineum]